MITLNGTTGITNDGGYTGDGVVFADTTPANTLVTTTGGLVGIGTSSPAYKLQVNGAIVSTDGTTTARMVTSGGVGLVSTLTNHPLAFQTNDVERARIDSSGNLLVGTASPGGSAATRVYLNKGGTTWQVGPGIVGSGNNFWVLNSSDVGVVMLSGATSWSANSDERLKTTLTPFQNAAEKVASLRAGTGRYLKDDEGVSRSFLIAQDVQAVLPEAVDVGEDEMGALSLRYTDTIPLLVAAIQEQQAIITAQAAQIQQLREKVLEVEEGTSNMLIENTNNLYETITALTARVAALDASLDARLTSLEGTQP